MLPLIPPNPSLLAMPSIPKYFPQFNAKVYTPIY